MNLDGLTLSVLAKEINNAVQSGQIQKLYQIDKTTLLFKIRTARQDADLIITVGSDPAIYLGTAPQDLPKEPSSLCMFLRKHIEGSRIVGVEQINGDRILCIRTDKLELDGTIQSTEIYIELMGKYSNCIFVQNDRILESLIHVSPLMNRERSIGPKLPYELPPNSNRVNVFDFDESELNNLFTAFGTGTVIKSIRNLFNGFGKPLLVELLLKADLTGDEDLHQLSDGQLHSLCAALYTLGRDIMASTALYEYTSDGDKTVVSPVKLHYGTLNRKYTSLSSAVEESINKSGAIHTADRELQKIITNAVKKEELRHEKIERELHDTDKMDTYKLYGDILMINAHLPIQYESSVDLPNILSEDETPLTIPLRPTLTIVENAQYYYKLYTKLKNRMISGRYQLEQSGTKLAYFQSILYSLNLATDRQGLEEIRQECMEAGIIKKSKKPLSYKLNKSNYIHLEIPEGDLYIGRNNRQNEYLTHRFARPTDIWFHTQNIQGSHLILRPRHEPDDMTISKVAQYAAYFSRARESGKVAVDYTFVKNIKKPPGSPPGFVIFNTHQTMTVEPRRPIELQKDL